MIIVVDPDKNLLQRAAALHCRILPNSTISRIGLRYAEAFYNYAAKSKREFVFVAVGCNGELLGSSILSLEPASLGRRLLTQSPLIPALLANPLVGIRLGLDRLTSSQPKPCSAKTPEVISIFVEMNRQGSGIGSQLVRAVERLLVERSIPCYCIRTENSPRNRAIDFYRNLGFRNNGVLSIGGVEYCMMIQTVPSIASREDAT